MSGLCVIGFQVSYGLPILFKLIFQPSDFPKTSMDLGMWSKPFGIISCLWLFGTSCLLFFPVENPVDKKNMNWLIVVVASAFVVGSVNWFTNSQYHFKGPTRHEDILTSGNAITKENIGSVKFDAAGRVIRADSEGSSKETDLVVTVQ